MAFEIWETSPEIASRFRLIGSMTTGGKAVDEMLRLDDSRPNIARFVKDSDNRVMAQNRWYRQLADRIEDTPPFWIVVSLDRPGPVERGQSDYTRHSSFDKARDEARSLTLACRGGRFAVCGSVFVTGWIEQAIESEIPF